MPVSWMFAASAFALPPGDTRFRDGANHHLGDDSFVAATGHAPTARDREAARMRVHLTHVRQLLAARPAPTPALAARRAELLGYLDDYIAHGTTPVNEALPWRTPVFIDANGTICAVGYLIERTAGRELAERIARAHRYDFLEDIADAMPEVGAWVAASGFTLDELASIQPGYMQPQIEDWIRWDVAALPPPDGAYRDRVTTGAWKHRRMEGAWVRTEADGTVVGRGELHAGSGAWTSFYRTGAKMAEGRLVRNDPEGAWTIYHPSGNVAAQGRFARGLRDGAWRFFYDAPSKTPIATGKFARGQLVGAWQHFDAAGKLLARSTSERGDHVDGGFGSYLLSVEPGADRVKHEAHLIGGPDLERLDSYARGRDRLYVYRHAGAEAEVFDVDGRRLRRVVNPALPSAPASAGGAGLVAATWHAAPCPWSAKRKRIARAGDVTTLHRLLFRGDRNVEDACVGDTAVPAARSAEIDELMALSERLRAASPTFVRALALGDDVLQDPPRPEGRRGAGDDRGASDDDLAELLARHMVWYIEWPHIDRRFLRLFKTIPGYWPGRPNGAKLPEEERAKLVDANNAYDEPADE